MFILAGSPVFATVETILQFAIRRMVPDDLKETARLHEQAFAGFFLTRMGPTFLRGYYAAVLSYDRSIALIADRSDGQPIGFVTGFQDPEAFYAHFRNQRLRLLPSIVGAVLRQPSLARAIFSNVRLEPRRKCRPRRFPIAGLCWLARTRHTNRVLLASRRGNNTNAPCPVLRFRATRSRYMACCIRAALRPDSLSAMAGHRG